MRRIRVKFNDNKQSVDFIVGENIKAFLKKRGCYAEYWNRAGRKQRRGPFGYIRLPSMVGVKSAEYSELVSHEVYHLVDDWWRCRKGNVMSDANEEKRAEIHGEIVRKFWRAVKR